MLNWLQRNSKGKRECGRKTEKIIKMIYGDSKPKYRYNQKSAAKFIIMNMLIDYRKLKSEKIENKVLCTRSE